MALALGSDGDIALNTAGLPHFIGGGDEAAQRMRVRFRFVHGEWYRDTRLGVPYFEHVLVKAPNLVLIRSLFRQLIKSVPGIVAIDRLGEDFDRQTRTLRPVFACRYEDGTTITDREVLPTLQPLEVP